MTIRITLKRLLIALFALGIGGMLFAWSGAMQISASSGHWRITDWFLHWTMRNSVRTHAAFDTPERVIDRSGMVSAAGHFAQACAVCHGAPGVKPSPVMQAATPPAPDLAVNARQWSDRQLFWIIRHGVKFTGMPAWPADRPDEVARMVGFVRALPTMTPERYRALIRDASQSEPTGVPQALLARCTGCHGADGRGRGQGDIPVLGGQHPAYLETALRRYADGARPSAVMQAAAATLSATEMKALSRHFAAIPGLTATIAARDPIVTQGDPARQLPACTHCHAPGKSAPLLGGQKPTYIAARLAHWRGDPAVIDAHKSAATMAVIARRIPQARVDAIAHSFAASVTRE